MKRVLIPLILLLGILFSGTAFALNESEYNTGLMINISSLQVSKEIRGSSYILEASIINKTTSGISDNQNITNCSFYYRLTTGTRQLIGHNNSYNLTKYSIIWDTTARTDAINYTINVTCWHGNNTGGMHVTSIHNETTLVTIDNTLSTTAFGSATPSNGYSSDGASETITTKTDASISSCTIYFTNSTGTTNFSVTPSPGVGSTTNYCTYTFSDLNKGSYEYWWVTNDGLNISTGRSTDHIRSLQVVKQGLATTPTGVTLEAESMLLLSARNGVIIVILIVLAFAIVGGYFLLRKK